MPTFSENNLKVKNILQEVTEAVRRKKHVESTYIGEKQVPLSKNQKHFKIFESLHSENNVT